MAQSISLVEKIKTVDNGDDFYLKLKDFMNKFSNTDNYPILNESDSTSSFYRLDKDVLIRLDIVDSKFYFFVKHFIANNKELEKLNIQFSGKYSSTTPFRFEINEKNYTVATKYIKKYMATFNCYVGGKKSFLLNFKIKKNVKLPEYAAVYIEGKLYGHLDNLKIISLNDKFVARCISDGEKFNLFDRDKYIGYIENKKIYDTMNREIGQLKKK